MINSIRHVCLCILLLLICNDHHWLIRTGCALEYLPQEEAWTRNPINTRRTTKVNTLDIKRLKALKNKKARGLLWFQRESTAKKRQVASSSSHPAPQRNGSSAAKSLYNFEAEVEESGSAKAILNAATTQFSWTAVGFWKYFEEGPGTVGSTYQNNMDVIWQIKARNAACHVVVEFMYIHIEKGYDFIYVYPSGKNVGPNTSLNNTKAGPWYVSTNDKITIEFTTDDSVTYQGFRARYIQNCNAVIDSRNWAMFTATNSWKTLDYPSENKPYDVLQNRHFLIVPSTLNCRVVIEFTQIRLDFPTQSNPVNFPDVEGDYLKLLLEGRDYQEYVYAEDDEGQIGSDSAQYPRIAERMMGEEPRFEIGLQLVTDTTSSDLGFTCKYKQVCNYSPYRYDWSLNGIYYGTSTWKTFSDTYAEGIAHPYQMYPAYEVRPTHVGCKALLYFTYVADRSAYPYPASNFVLYIKGIGYDVEEGKIYEGDPSAGGDGGDGKIWFYWYIDETFPHIRMFDASYMESC
jgi:hypothetical protein